MSRPGPFAAHKCQDYIIQAIRNELKKYDGEVIRERPARTSAAAETRVSYW